MIYLDNGATSFPKPKRVVAAITEAAARFGANPGRSGHQMSMQTARKVYETREEIASLLGASSPDEVIFTPNCTYSVNIALKGLLRPGDHIIISDLEHNAVLRPVHAMQGRGIITYSIAETFKDPQETVNSFSRLIRPQTRMIVCTHASNVFGTRLPVEELGALCREKDLLFLVDAAQTAGVLPINAAETGIDFLCAPGHKGLYGPSGTGVLITPLGSLLETVIEGGTGSFSADYDQPREMPDRLESGTVNFMGIMGLGAGARYVKEKTTDIIYGHEMKLASEIFRRVSQTPGVTLYTPDFGEGTHVPVLSFNVGDLSSEEATLRLSDMGFATRGGLHCAPLAHKKMGTLDRGTVRASVGVFNTHQQCVQFCDAVKSLLKPPARR